MAADADRLKALQAGDTPERIAEKAREAAVLAGLKTGIQAVE